MKLNFVNRRLSDARDAGEVLYGQGEVHDAGEALHGQDEAPATGASPCWMYIEKNRRNQRIQRGPASRCEIQTLLHKGEIDESTMVWTTKMLKYTAVGELPQFDCTMANRGIGPEEEATSEGSEEKPSRVDINKGQETSDGVGPEDCRVEKDESGDMTPFSRAASRRKKLHKERTKKFEENHAKKVDIARARRMEHLKEKKRKSALAQEERQRRILAKQQQRQREEHQRCWLVRLVIGFSTAKLGNMLEDRAKSVRAAVFLQRWWRKANPCAMRRLVLTMQLRKHRGPLMLRIFRDRQHKAADRLSSFLHSQLCLKRIALVFNKLRWRIVTVQRCVRAFLHCRRARMAALSTMWRALEADHDKMELLQEKVGLLRGQRRQQRMRARQRRVVDLESEWEKEHFWKAKAVRGKVTGLLNDLERRSQSKLARQNNKRLQQQKERWMRQHMQMHKQGDHASDTASGSSDAGDAGNGRRRSSNSSSCGGGGGSGGSGGSSSLACAEAGVGVRGLVSRGRRAQALLRLLLSVRRRHVAHTVEAHKNARLRWKALQDGGGQVFTVEEARQVVRKSSDAACILQLIQSKINAACRIDEEEEEEMENKEEDRDGEAGGEGDGEGGGRISPSITELVDQAKMESELEGARKKQQERAAKLLKLKRKRQKAKQQQPTFERPPFFLYSAVRKMLDSEVNVAMLEGISQEGCRKSNNNSKDGEEQADFSEHESEITQALIACCTVSSRRLSA